MFIVNVTLKTLKMIQKKSLLKIPCLKLKFQNQKRDLIFQGTKEAYVLDLIIAEKKLTQ